MSETFSNVSDFREPVRAFLGDFNSTVRKYQDSAIDSVVRTVLRCAEVPGYGLKAGDVTMVDPGVNEPKGYALLTYKVCKRFIAPSMAAQNFRTRALGMSTGEQRLFYFDLEAAISNLENGEMFSCWSDFRTWATAITGVRLWESLTEMTVRSPVARVTVGRDGVQVNTESTS